MGFWKWLKDGIPVAQFLIGMTSAFACGLFGVSFISKGEPITGIFLGVLALIFFLIGLHGLYKDMEVNE